MDLLENRYTFGQLAFCNCFAESIDQRLSNLSVSFFTATDPMELLEFVNKVYQECLRPLSVFFSEHTTNISPRTLVALWLYSIITTGGSGPLTISRRCFSSDVLSTKYFGLWEVFGMFFDLTVEQNSYFLRAILAGTYDSEGEARTSNTPGDYGCFTMLEAGWTRQQYGHAYNKCFSILGIPSHCYYIELLSKVSTFFPSLIK